MTRLAGNVCGGALLTLALAVCPGIGVPDRAGAAEIGQPAPDFKLPSTFGHDIALSDFRGKKFVLVEFYGADFAPT